jgi:small-conductance mechanosensitive channel
VTGAVLVAAALDLAGFDGPLLAAMGTALVLGAVQYFGARWIGSWLFPVGERWDLTLGLPDRARAEGRAYTDLLGAILALGTVLVILAEVRGWGEGTRAVAVFPLQLAIGAMLVRLGQLMARHAGHYAEPEEPGGEVSPDRYAGPLLRNVGRASMAVGVLGPVAAAVGLGALAQAVLVPAVMSLALIGFLVIVQQVVRDLYALAAGRDDGARDALLPVLIGFGIALCSLPVFALLWGARVSDLTEVWARIRAGVRLGETVVSPGAILSFAAILAIGVLLTRLVQGALRAQVLPRTRIDTGGRTAIVSGVGYVGFILAAVFAVTGAGIDLTSLAFVAGALSVGIGFGLQNVVNNFVSGVILLIERPISEGDWIQVGDQMGYVRSISVRSTRIETFDRTDVIVPNADLISGTVTNWTRGNLIGRIILPVGVAYGTDTRLVERVLRDVAEAHPMVLLKPPPSILFRRFGADAMEFEIRAILRDVNWVLSVETEMNHEIARRFAEEGIEIPFAQRDVWLRNPDALRAGSEPVPEAAELRAEGGGEIVAPAFLRREDAARGEGGGGRP